MRTSKCSFRIFKAETCFLVSNCFLEFLKKGRKVMSISRRYISQGQEHINGYGKRRSPIYSLHKYSPRE